MNKQGKPKPKDLKKFFIDGGLIIVFVALLCGVVIMLYIHQNMVAICGTAARTAGTLVGRATGSFEGMTAGIEDGKNAGLSAEDTTTTIANRIREMNNLEVLIASVSLTNFHSVGEDYASLYQTNAEVVFTVDMDQAQISNDEGVMKIVLPNPVCEIYTDYTSTEKLAEYQKHFYSGSVEAGVQEYLNSLVKGREVTRETLSNYDELEEAAKESAVQQIEALENYASVSSTYDVNITFEDLGDQ